MEVPELRLIEIKNPMGSYKSRFDTDDKRLPSKDRKKISKIKHKTAKRQKIKNQRIQAKVLTVCNWNRKRREDNRIGVQLDG